MGKGLVFSLILSVVAALAMPKIGRAEASAVTGKAFAIFVASYNSSNDEARGGVAGTAFFVSPTHAQTAFHVLQARSFRPLPGFEKVRVWLVHENYPAIEIRLEDVTFDPDHDSTKIVLTGGRRVAQRFVFATDRLSSLTRRVESEGFPANSVGPVLERRGSDLVVVAVPRLTRLHLSGEILRHSEISLRSRDLNLKSAPCVQLSYQPIVGFSGGPVVSNGKVIGMNSFADPDGTPRTWAQQIQN